jgi:hypothetical protein
LAYRHAAVASGVLTQYPGSFMGYSPNGYVSLPSQQILFFITHCFPEQMLEPLLNPDNVLTNPFSLMFYKD